jgi:hypothetical protein
MLKTGLQSPSPHPFQPSDLPSCGDGTRGQRLSISTAGAFTWTADAEALRKRAHIYTPQAIQRIWNITAPSSQAKLLKAQGLLRPDAIPPRRRPPPSILP